MFVEGRNIELTINSNNLGYTRVSLEDNDYGYFQVNSLWISDYTAKKLSAGIMGIKEMSKAETVILSIKIGGQKYRVPINIFVHDLNFIKRLETNISNDTIFISKGRNFLLKITCIDTSNKIISKAQINSLGIDYIYFLNQNYGIQKIVATTLDKDDISFTFLLSVLPDIMPGDEDKLLDFTFHLSSEDRFNIKEG